MTETTSKAKVYTTEEVVARGALAYHRKLVAGKIDPGWALIMARDYAWLRTCSLLGLEPGQMGTLNAVIEQGATLQRSVE